MRLRKKHLLLAVIVAAILGGCKKWDDHVAVENADLTRDLYTIIANDPALSRFGDLVSKAGLDTLLHSSKNYTIWAPSNDALATLDPSIPTDVVKLRSFILNHISNQLYFTKDAPTVKRVAMLNGKYHNFQGNKIEDATIINADKFVKNGVLHIIDKNMLVLPNLWDFITSTTAQYTQNSFIAGLNFTTFDSTLATIDSISSSTGLPVYHVGTGIVSKNSFNDRLFDARREDKQYTYFVIANAGFTLKADSLKPYFNTTSTTRTDSLDKWNIIKDLIIDTLYATAGSLPAVIISKSGIPILVNSSLIIDTRKLSNGIVYVLSLSGTTTSSKFQPFTIQGENPTGFQQDKTSNTNFIRIRRDRPDTTKNYTDLMVTGHGVTDFYSFYRLNDMPTMKYNVFARAINDFQTQEVVQSISPWLFVPPATFTQIAAVPAFVPAAPRTPGQLWFPVPSTRGGTTPLPAQYSFTAPSFAPVSLPTPDGAFTELFLGSFTSTQFGILDIRLLSGATATLPALPVFGATGTGPIVLDYIRIVPVP